MTSDRIEIDQDQVERLRRAGRSWTEIAEVVGCSLRTIKRRAKAWGLTEIATEAVQQAAEHASKVAQARWTLRRAEEADRAGQVASRTLVRLNQIIPDVAMGGKDEGGLALTVFRLARSYEILVKNAQLLSGGATERHEGLGDDAFMAEWRRLETELAGNDEPDHEHEPAAE